MLSQFLIDQRAAVRAVPGQNPMMAIGRMNSRIIAIGERRRQKIEKLEQSRCLHRLFAFCRRCIGTREVNFIRLGALVSTQVQSLPPRREVKLENHDVPRLPDPDGTLLNRST